jgi:hypothetical protein
VTTSSKKPDNPQVKRKSPNPAGRTPIPIDLELVERLCQIACTDEEIASIVGVSHETLVRRKREPAFAELMHKARSTGKASLRRIQWRLAENGNAAICIWLGKQLLGQRDRFDDLGEDKNPLPWAD